LLQEIQASGKLRVVTRNSPTTYYIGANGPEGPEYELIRGFANFIGVDLELQTAPSFASIFPIIKSGKADVAAAGLTMTPDRAREVVFGPTFQPVTQHLIYKLGTGRPHSLRDVLGKRLEVIAGTSYVHSLVLAQQKLRDLVWIEDPHSDIAELLTAVADGRIDYTIADSTVFSIYQNFLPEIRIAFDISGDDSVAWAFPKYTDRGLIARVRQYLDFIRDNGEFDRIMDRYYGHTKRFDYVGTRQFIRDYNDKLPPYRKMFRDAARRIDIDWRLLAAIGYQESHWDPMAVSPTGVRGIMMLTRNTARSIGIEDRVDPEQSIFGGAEYFAGIKRRIPASIPEPDRTWLALAAYNVGYGHLEDARTITRMNGGDPTRWIDVKPSLLLLTRKKWYSQVKSGYARGWEPVQYVENIRSYYNILVWLSHNDEIENPQQPDTETDRPTTIAAL